MVIEKLSVKVVFTYSLYSSEANTEAIDMRLTPGFGINENVNVAMSNSLVGPFETADPAEDKLPAGIGEPGTVVTLPVPSTMPLVIPSVEPVVVNVPEMLVAAPAPNTGVPVSVTPGFPAAIAFDKVVTLVVVVIVTVAWA